jgi:hypothetical protein
MEFDSDAIFDDTSLAEELNRETRTVSGSVRYAATPLTTVVVTTDATADGFTLSKIRNTDSRQTLLGVELSPRALISGSAQLGYQRFRPQSAAVPDFNGLVGSAVLSYRFRRSTTFGFSFSRNSFFSYFQEEPYYIRGGYGLSIRQPLLAGWDVEVGGARFSHRYRQVAEAPGARTVMGHSERFLDSRMTFGYDMGPRTRFTTSVSYQDVRSDFDRRIYDGLRLGTSVEYGF